MTVIDTAPSNGLGLRASARRAASCRTSRWPSPTTRATCAASASRARASAGGAQIAFCSAALAWDYKGDVHDGTSITGPDSGYPDAFLRPDPSAFRWLPWRRAPAT